MAAAATYTLLERDLTGTLDMLRRYSRGQHLQRVIHEVAHAEAYQQDPLATHMAGERATQDAYGIADAFA